LYALLAGHLPFDDENIRQLLNKVKAGKFHMPTDIPSGARDLISRMLTVNPKRRITVRVFLPLSSMDVVRVGEVDSLTVLSTVSLKSQSR
jgi:serine/threonine protein kinase